MNDVELLKLDDALERTFYEMQAVAERWSVAELKRQKAASLFLRLANSKDQGWRPSVADSVTFCARTNRNRRRPLRHGH